MARFGGVYLEVGGVEEVRQCREFYENTLGFSVASVNEDESFWLEAGDMTFGFHTGEGPPRETRWAVNLVLKVDEGTTVDQEAQRLSAAGVKLHMEPTDMPWGMRVITFLDPAGHAVWYSQPL